MMIAASEEATCCSPAPISGHGITNSTVPNTASHFQRPRSASSFPARQASSSSTVAPRTTRASATTPGGTPSSTATLMKRYGTPHNVETVANAAHARGLIYRRASPTIAANSSAR